MANEAPSPPGAHFTGNVSFTAGKPLNSLDVEAITKGTTHAMYVSGVIFYEDSFGLPHKTQFCAFIESDSLRRARSLTAEMLKKGNAPAKADINWSFSHLHNEAT